MQKKKNKAKIAQYIPIIFMVAIGAVCGLMFNRISTSIFDENTLFIYKIFALIPLLFVIYVAAVVQIVIHEAGHMVFGLISGYKFSSFRILSFMWIKENDKIKFKRCKVAGTDGQCLMLPPDMTDGTFPVILYNLGGTIMNVLVSIVALILWIVLKDFSPVVSGILFLFAMLGFGLAALNGIPMRMANVDNDGYNAYSLSRNDKARRAFWLQLKVNSLMSNGIRLKDMPDEWFEIPSDDDMKNSMVAAGAVFSASRLMDQHRFDEADKLMAHLLETDSGIVGLHRMALISERIYIELITENRKDVVEGFLTKEQKAFMNAMKTNITIVRTEYAYALLCEKDHKKAASLKAKFDKYAKKSPYAGDIRSEKELVEIAEQKLS